MAEEKLVRFPLLAEHDYDPNTFLYTNNAENGMPQLKDWIQVFRSTVPAFQRMAEQDESVDASVREGKAAAFAKRFYGVLDTLLENPEAELEGFEPSKVQCKRLCHLRDTCLREAGFWDPYAKIKAEENTNALALLREVLDELDSVSDPQERLGQAVRGVFAGNVFDLGAPKMVELANQGLSSGEMFKNARATLVDRPWAVDKLDELLVRMRAEGGPTHKKAIVFADNAGSDVVLGMIPFMRELLKRGTEVILAVNPVPSINDITVPEMQSIMDRVCKIDSVLCENYESGRWRLISSGNDLPVIDLRYVSEAAAAEAQTADLVVLEGMGRGIETNLYAKFTVDSLKLAMIKHPEVATCLKGRLYDCVCQYYPASSVQPPPVSAAPAAAATA